MFPRLSAFWRTAASGTLKPFVAASGDA